MSDSNGHLTEGQKKAVAHLIRRITFSPEWETQSGERERQRRADVIAKIYANAKIGDEMPDGTVCAGVSPDTKEKMYVVPFDAPLQMTFNDAAKYAEKLEFGGRKDFRVPSVNELLELSKNLGECILKKTLGFKNVFYWSSTNFGARSQAQAVDIHQGKVFVSQQSSTGPVRCVR